VTLQSPVPVEPQNERARLLDKLLPRDLAVLVFIEVAEIRFSQGGVHLLDRYKFGRIKLSIVIAICRREDPLGKLFPFVTGVDTIAVGIPDGWPVLDQGVLLCWWWGLPERGYARQKQPNSHTDTVYGFSAKHVPPLSLLRNSL
jgi:hypothetical protein